MKQFIFLFSIILSTGIYSQKNAIEFDNLVSKDSTIVPILFSYPDSVYTTILIASTYPNGFVNLNELQKTSSDSFKKLISSYNRSRQKQLWELTRYPELISILIKNKEKTEKDLEEILKKYPNSINNSAIYFLRNEYSTLLKIENIHLDFETKYSKLLKDFPEDVKKSYNTLLSYPEIITMLSEDIKTTMTLGELYKKDPASVKQKADSINFEITKEKGIEFENWKMGINRDSAVQKELMEVAKNYSQEDEYDDDIYAKPTDKRDVKKVYEVATYPYWAGYPYWYERNYWYPYPWWFHMGFYWPLNSPIQFFGLPSYHFGWWYYNQPNPYYHRHPNTTNYFYRHYQNRKNYNSDFNRSTHEFYRGRRK